MQRPGVRILATLTAFVLIAEATAGFDAPARQIHIESHFVELSRTDSLQLGLQFFGKNERLDSATRDSFLSEARDIRSDYVAGVDALLNDPEVTGNSEGQLALDFFVAATGSFDVLLRALENDKKVKLLSKPAILALNQQQAGITVLQQVPFLFSMNKRKLNREGNAHRMLIEYRRTDLALTGYPEVFDGIPFLAAFLKKGGKEFLQKQGLQPHGPGRFSSKKQRGSKHRFLSVRADDDTEQDVGVDTRAVFPTGGTTAAADIGIFLKVTPRVVDRAGVVFLEVNVTDELGANTGEFALFGTQIFEGGQMQGFTADQTGIRQIVPLPNVSVSSVVTPVFRMDGQTVVIGGLVRETANADRMFRLFDEVPFVGDFFRASVGGIDITKKNSTGVADLIVLMTPTIVRNGE